MPRSAFVLLAVLLAAGCQSSPSETPTPAASETPAPGATPAGPSAALLPAVAPESLAALFPTQVGDMARGEVTAESDGAMGMTVSRASAVYGTGPQAVTLLVVDVGSAEGARLMGLSVPPTGRLKGVPVQRTQTPTSAAVRMLVDGRFLIEASGNRVGPDLLDVFVQTINLGALPRA